MSFRHEIVGAIVESRIIAIIRGLEGDDVLALAQLAVEEDVRAIEVTLNTPNALDTIASLKRELGNAAVVGAGTVLDEKTAGQAILAGAEFVVAPNLKVEVVQAAHRYGKPAIPGTMTPGEIIQAAEAGADLIKVFPALSLGVQYFAELRGPLGHLAIMPTGGITPQNAANFWQQGAVALGVGGSLVRRDLIQERKWEEIRAIARALRLATAPTEPKP